MQKFAEKKGDLIGDDAITIVAKMYDIDQMERLNWRKELHDRKKISWIFDNIIWRSMHVMDRLTRINTQ